MGAVCSPLPAPAVVEQTTSGSAPRIRRTKSDDPAMQARLAELSTALAQYRDETEQGLRGAMTMRSAFAALDTIRAVILAAIVSVLRNTSAALS